MSRVSFYFRSAARIAGAFVIFVSLAYFGLVMARAYDASQGYKLANSFCQGIRPGSPVEEAIASARNEPTRFLKIYDNEMILGYSGTCHCRIHFVEGKAFPGAAICND